MEKLNLIGGLGLVGVLFAGVAFLALATFIANRRVGRHYDFNHELVENDNLALALRRMGLLVGLAIPLSWSLGVDFLTFSSAAAGARDAAIIIALMFSAIWISDKFLLPHVDNDQEIKNQNLTVGIIDFGLLLATGLVLQGAFSGAGVWYSSIVFFLLGQVFLVATVKIYAARVLKHTKSHTYNKSTAILMASYLIGLGIIMRGSLIGDFTDWTADILSFVVWASIGTALLILFTAGIVNKIFLHTSSIDQEIEDENVAGLMYVGAIKIAVSILVSNIVLL